jgi:hypothetical protein
MVAAQMTLGIAGDVAAAAPLLLRLDLAAAARPGLAQLDGVALGGEAHEVVARVGDQRAGVEVAGGPGEPVGQAARGADQVVVVVVVAHAVRRLPADVLHLARLPVAGCVLEALGGVVVVAGVGIPARGHVAVEGPVRDVDAAQLRDAGLGGEVRRAEPAAADPALEAGQRGVARDGEGHQALGAHVIGAGVCRRHLRRVAEAAPPGDHAVGELDHRAALAALHLARAGADAAARLESPGRPRGRIRRRDRPRRRRHGTRRSCRSAAFPRRRPRSSSRCSCRSAPGGRPVREASLRRSRRWSIPRRDVDKPPSGS